MENFNVQTNNSKNYGQDAIYTLVKVAYVALFGGILGALMIWRTIGYVDNGLNPDGVILGFVVLFSSIVTSSLLFVVCGIAKNLIAIRKNTEK